MTAELLIAASLAIGQGFWHDRGVQPCPNPQVIVKRSLWDAADSPRDAQGRPVDTVWGRAVQGGCTIWLARWTFRRYRRLDFCRTVVHELGHTAGLDHDHDAVMAGRATPYACKVWVRRLQRRER